MFIEASRRSMDRRWWAIILAAAWLFAGSGAAAQTPIPDFPFPQPIVFQGQQIVLDLVDSSGLGAGTVLRFRLRQSDHRFRTFTTTTDAGGRFTIALDASGLADRDAIVVFIETSSGQWAKRFPTLRRSPDSPSNHTPSQPSTNLPVPICTSEACGAKDCGSFSPEIFTATNEARDSGVNLADGTVMTRLPVLAFPTRILGFDLVLHHQSLTRYDGPVGNWSHTFNMFLVQVSSGEAAVVTPDLQSFPFFRGGATAAGPWTPPEGFFGRLEQDEARQRWIFTHHTGTRFEFLLGRPGLPGPLIGIEEPNGNRLLARLDPSGFLTAVETDLGQTVRFAYGSDSRLASMTDPIGRLWTFAYDERGRLVRVTAPVTEFAGLQAGQEITETDLPHVLVTRGRTTSFAYEDQLFPGQITRMTDERGAVPVAYTYVHEGTHAGRVAVERLNGKDVNFTYGPAAGQAPFPLPLLETGNTVTRVVDREGNVIDHEIHGPGGGPLDHKGAFGLRRRVQWTERGKGNLPLRPGATVGGEPLYWEQRWLQDCDCLSPAKVSQPFRSDDALTFDNQGMPAGYPTEIFGYNPNRQVISYEFRGGAGESIRWQKTYDSIERFSRMLSYTEPRGFDDNPLYAGLDFTHLYLYDGAGNLIEHRAPTVRRGVAGQQTIVEAWTYNQFGQVLTHRDPNGNLTANTYFTGPAVGGDINTRGELGGYLASTTRGAPGSTDSAPALTTRFRVNALGMITEKTDPKGFVYGTEYNDLGETTRQIEPEVTLSNGTKAHYETRFIFDGAGNRILERRRNVDFDGTVAPGEFIDRAMSYDAVGNLLSVRVEVDEDDAHDLVIRYAYDGNDQQSAVQKPEGNRAFMIYDERRLPFKTFYGIAPGPTPAASYPADKRAQRLGGTPFVGFTATTYDARENAVQDRDGRGNLARRFFDFANRRTAERDPNGNGRLYAFDDASNVITEQGGAISETGAAAGPLERSYYRYDEAGRRYQAVRDVDLASDESGAIDPDDSRSSSYLISFDSSSRLIRRFDANGNPQTLTYDATGRPLTVTDALGNVISVTYDPNSNLVRLEELEMPGPGATGDRETYVTTYDYDERDRLTSIHARGLNGSIDHQTVQSYDSRGNRRLTKDAEGLFTLFTFDAADRQIQEQRFDGDPAAGGSVELTRIEHGYNRNDSKLFDLVRSDVHDRGSAQVTRYFYDSQDRLMTTVYPDAEDPGGNGDECAGPFDGVRLSYDANSNLVRAEDQRGVVFTNSFDVGDRLIRQDIEAPLCVPGVRRQELTWDALNRLANASNDYSQVLRRYDTLSRLTLEVQRLSLDGSGFTRGWESPVRVSYGYDKQSNRTLLRLGAPVTTAGGPDLEVLSSPDPLNRLASLKAAYFDQPLHPIATYAHFGPERLQTKTLGNGAMLLDTYDAKRRVAQHAWLRDSATGQRPIVAYEYGYDRVDNALFERHLHDQGRFDNFSYNGRYELTGVNYRSTVATDYRVDSPAYDTTFSYNDASDRSQATFATPLGGVQPRTLDLYTSNRANEYTALQRNVNGIPAGLLTPRHDAAGNWADLLLRPAQGTETGRDVPAHARFDAFNRLFDVKAGENRRQHFRYDVLGRRIVALELSSTTAGDLGPNIDPGSRRFIWDDWHEIAERIFLGGATLGSAPSRLERVHVHGAMMDEILLTAVDGDGNGSLSGADGHPKNDSAGPDFEYYLLGNRLGSVMALLDADDPTRVLESYRYTVYGELAILGTVAGNGNTFSPRINSFLFTGQRLDAKAGLYYYRMRYMDPVSGRFIQRDPAGWWADALAMGNAYAYVGNNPVNFVDPFGQWGLSKVFKGIGKVGKALVGGAKEVVGAAKTVGEKIAEAARNLPEPAKEILYFVVTTAGAVAGGVIGAAFGPPGVFFGAVAGGTIVGGLAGGLFWSQSGILPGALFGAGIGAAVGGVLADKVGWAIIVKVIEVPPFTGPPIAAPVPLPLSNTSDREQRSCGQIPLLDPGCMNCQVNYFNCVSFPPDQERTDFETSLILRHESCKLAEEYCLHRCTTR